MAAVLFELTYPELTDSIPENMDHDRKVQYRVKAYEKIPARDRDVMELRDALSCLEDEYSDWDGEIDWRSGSDYAEAFLDEMKRIIEPMIEKGEYRKAFEGLKQACFVLETADLNGSLGEHSLITRKIREYWESIIPRSSPEEKEMMFEWLRGLKLHDVYKHKNYFMDIYVVRKDLQAEEIVPDETEVTDCKWLSKDEIEQFIADGKMVRSVGLRYAMFGNELI